MRNTVIPKAIEAYKEQRALSQAAVITLEAEMKDIEEKLKHHRDVISQADRGPSIFNFKNPSIDCPNVVRAQLIKNDAIEFRFNYAYDSPTLVGTETLKYCKKTGRIYNFVVKSPSDDDWSKEIDDITAESGRIQGNFNWAKSIMITGMNSLSCLEAERKYLSIRLLLVGGGDHCWHEVSYAK